MPNSTKLMRDQSAALETDCMIPIVVGAHPRAEHTDRPIAYRLRELMNLWLANHAEHLPDPLTPIVVTDVWYLNDAALRERPSVSVGGPNVNAFTAYLADKLPSAFTIDDVLTVQMDLAMSDVLAACWGTGSPDTLRAVDAFCERYLDQFMDAAVNEV
ncbi:MAG: hypothetical protein IT438_11290 [Phycisphaerales bacterium]|nr:hypothetical protein [Phycisphaerales bacterium]